HRTTEPAPQVLMAEEKAPAAGPGRPDLFLGYYPTASNRDWTPPRPGALAATVPEDMAAAIGARIEAAQPRAIVWWFTEPNAWERQLADALVRAGSIRTELPPRPMWSADRQAASANPLGVETPWWRRQARLH